MSSNEEVLKLKQKLEGWKVILLPVNSLLEWNKQYDPFVIIFVDTFIFGLLMYYNPSLLTTISLLGLTLLLFESVVPFLTGYFMKNTEWDDVSESKYHRICERIHNFIVHVRNFRIKLENIRKERQSLYFLIVFFFLVFCAYVGQSVDNFLLTYIAVIALTLTPGIRRKHLVQKTLNKIKYNIGIGKISEIPVVNEQPAQRTQSRRHNNDDLHSSYTTSSYEYTKRK